MERQPYHVFLESWGAEMGSIEWRTPFPPECRERALHALRSGRWRAWSYARDVLGWRNEEAVLACRFIELAFLHWMRSGGEDRDVLLARLEAAQERGRTELTLSDGALRRADSLLEAQLGRI
ncbi:MAG TPA: hypothetical protein VGR37_19545 [Longimicrobiaceae bacterium]|nr:hypothetical protein [Longimicrobiaceae bacterium]